MDRRRWRGLWLVVALVVALLSACGDITIPIPGMSSGATATPATKPSGTAAVPKAQVGGLPAGFPANFPMPQGHQIQSGIDDGRQFAVLLTVTSAQEACIFYKGALPGAGYQVQDLGGANVGGAFSGGLRISGNGFSGDVACTAVGGTPTVSIRLERGGAAQPAPTAAAGAIQVPAIPPIKPGLPTPGPGATPGTTGPTAPGGLPANFPPNFPLPPQYQVQSSSDDGRQASVVLSVQSAQAGYDFYKGVLPLSGYQVREEGTPRSSGGIFTGALSFTGNGLTGSMAFSSAGGANLITIGITRGGTSPATPVAKPGLSTPAPKPGEKPADKPGVPGTGGLPAGFPLPPGAQVQVQTDDGKQIAAVLGVQSAKDAFEFYKGALPGAGYQITDQNAAEIPGGGGYGGAIEINGNGFTGELGFAGNPAGQTVAIRLERTGGAAQPKPGEKPADKPGASTKPGPSVLPAGFPLPAEYTVQAAVDNGRQIAVVLIVPNPQAAYDFFKQQLPGAGYQVTERGVSNVPGGGFSGVLSIRGNGVSGEVVCTSASGQNMVAISLTKT